MALVVVEPEDHGRVPGKLVQQLPIVAHAMFAEHPQLFEHVVGVVHLGVAGGEDVVPEERHLLFQRTPGVYHVIQPVSLRRRNVSAGILDVGVVSKEQVVVCPRTVPRVDKLRHCRLVSLFDIPLKLISGRAESNSPHEVRHQSDIILVGHRVPPYHLGFNRVPCTHLAVQAAPSALA